MKKAVSLILALVMCLSLCACGGTEVALTTENIGEYLHIDSNVVDCNVDKTYTTPIYGYSVSSYKGDATIKVEVVNQSNATFSDVTIECEVHTLNSGLGTIYGWEFDRGNENQGQKYPDHNIKHLTIHLPADGNWRGNESLTLAIYGNPMNLLTAPDNSVSSYVKIISVTGTVTK